MRTISGNYNTSTGEWQIRSTEVRRSKHGALRLVVLGTMQGMNGFENIAGLSSDMVAASQNVSAIW